MNNSPRGPRKAVTCSTSDMRLLLHIITKTEDEFVKEIIQRQSAQPNCRVEIVDMNAGEPDYEAVLEKIFAADSVQVW